jgi:hypothetical protein
MNYESDDEARNLPHLEAAGKDTDGEIFEALAPVFSRSLRLNRRVVRITPHNQLTSNYRHTQTHTCGASRPSRFRSRHGDPCDQRNSRKSRCHGSPPKRGCV